MYQYFVWLHTVYRYPYHVPESIVNLVTMVESDTIIELKYNHRNYNFSYQIQGISENMLGHTVTILLNMILT